MKSKHKLLDIVASLQKTEIKKIRKMLKSQFFTRRDDLGTLFDVLTNLTSKRVTKLELIYSQVYPDKDWDYQCLRNAMSDLVRMIEKFWLIDALENAPAKSEIRIAEIYRKRMLNKSYASSIKKAHALFNAQSIRNAEFYTNSLDLLTQQMQYRSSTKRTEDLFLQEISDTNDVIYLIRKLQIICAQLSHKLVRKTEYDSGLIIELIDEINQEKYLKIPAIAIYYYCFLFMTKQDNLKYFRKFRALLEEYRHHFSTNEIETPYRLALNFCIRKTNEGHPSFSKDSWDLYKEGIQEGILLENNYISRFTFSNAIGAALRLKEYDWIENFINTYANQLEENFREQTIFFNLAKLEYAKKNFDKALIHLRSSEFKDVLNNMLSKILIVKIYMSTSAFEALTSHLDSFEQFIRRNKVSDYHKSNILNLIRFSRKIISLPDYSKKEIKKLKNQIRQETILSERDWLLEQL